MLLWQRFISTFVDFGIFGRKLSKLSPVQVDIFGRKLTKLSPVEVGRFDRKLSKLSQVLLERSVGLFQNNNSYVHNMNGPGKE